jgi:hypothetical protein
MPLTETEADFLAVYAYEYMRIEIGPATRKLKDRGFVYTDLTFLLEAYIKAHPPHDQIMKDDAGNLVEEFVFGRKDPNPPDPPWPSREAAQRRNAELEVERDANRIKATQ